MTQTPSIANPPVHMIPPGTRFTAPLHGILLDMAQFMSTSTGIYTVLESLLPLQSTQSCRRIKSPPIVAPYLPTWPPSPALEVLHNSTVPTWFNYVFFTGFDSSFTYSIRPKSFDWIRLSVSDSIRLMFLTGLDSRFFLIRLYSRLMQLFLIRVTPFDYHSSQSSGSPTLARVSSK